MFSISKRSIFWGVVAALVLGGLALSLRPSALKVDMLTVSRGDMLLTVSDEGKTRVEDVFVVSSPINGTVIYRNVVVGEHIEPDKILFTVSDLRNLWAILDDLIGWSRELGHEEVFIHLLESRRASNALLERFNAELDMVDMSGATYHRYRLSL